MVLSTTTAAFTITPVVLGTFFTHLSRKIKKRNIRDADDTEAVDDILFDEAFHIVKAFLELATRNKVDELQAFTNTYVPPPFWAECVFCTIPLPCCNKAADILIEWFGPEQLKTVVGGEKWWQVRGLDGVQAEWIAMKRDWDKLKKAEKRTNRSNHGHGRDTDKYSARLNEMKKTIFYVHGGGFYFGSINTHRYQIIRLARKLGGRAFAVNYRKSPQYPWPCPLQDVLAAYLYLLRPPPGAPHTAIDPKRLVIAGDSAGGNLCLSLLVVLRDMGLPMPSGAVLISPWVDLTHSFPSVMQNTTTDIIPPHGFVHKPSTLWPIAVEGPRAVFSDASDKPQLDFAAKSASTDEKADTPIQSAVTSPPKSEEPGRHPSEPSSTVVGDADAKVEERPLQVEVDGKMMEIRSQIHLYATNNQLTHPLVSPLLNSSLGNLCPLYILAGNAEVLRDEIVYLSHRCAEPARFPLREGLINAPRQKENIEKFKQPTQVHFQLFDDMCHVLTVFSFTTSANFAYAGIARFAKRVIEESNTKVEVDPFPNPADPDSIDPAVPVSRVPSGFDEKRSPETSKGDHIGRQRREGEAANEDDTIIEPIGEGNVKPENTISILCERVSIHGKTRPLECDDELEALQIPLERVGVVAEAPVKRWLDGQNSTDKVFRGRNKHLERKRQLIAQSAERLIAEKEARGQHPLKRPTMQKQMLPTDGQVLKEEDQKALEFYDDRTRRWSPFDLDDERPAPAAIAGRRDTPDALALIETAYYLPPPPAHPKEKRQPIILSPSEQQRMSNKIPVSHGVRIWSALMSKFMNTNLKRQASRSEIPDSASDKTDTEAPSRMPTT